MKIPSEAELIEMESDLRRLETFDHWIADGALETGVKLIALVRSFAAIPPIPPFQPRKKHRGLKVVSK